MIFCAALCIPKACSPRLGESASEPLSLVTICRGDWHRTRASRVVCSRSKRRLFLNGSLTSPGVTEHDLLFGGGHPEGHPI